MRVMLLKRLGPLTTDASPLAPAELPDAEPGPGELRLRVSVCGVCHMELDEIEARTPPPRLPVILGHEVVGDRLGVGCCEAAVPSQPPVCLCARRSATRARQESRGGLGRRH